MSTTAAAPQADVAVPMHKRVMDLLPGIAGGTARVLVGQPFDTIKTRLQVLGKGTALAATMPPEMVYNNGMDCVRKMVKSEGPFSLYKGTVAPLIGNMVLLGIHFPTFNKTRAYLQEGDDAKSFNPLKVYAAGGTAGLVGSVVSTPVELVRTKLMMQRKASLAGAAPAAGAQTAEFYKGTIDCIAKIGGRHGIRGLYQGFLSTVARDIQGYGCFFLGYEATIYALTGYEKPRSELAFHEILLAGIMAGFGLWGSMFPIDTIKSKIQADNLSNPSYKGTMDCVRKSLATEGHSGLWRGVSAAMLRAIPVNAAIFLAVESTRGFIDTHGHHVDGMFGVEHRSEELEMA